MTLLLKLIQYTVVLSKKKLEEHIATDGCLTLK